MSERTFDIQMFENPLQVGGIRTGTLDAPQPMGGRQVRVALVDTGAGLRFTVALDRGGDIYDAVHDDCPLAYLTPNGLQPPEEAAQYDARWLRAWPAGLVTTCGPLHIGAPLEADPEQGNLHGHHSNTAAAVRSIQNPDLVRGEREMRLELTIRDTRAFGPVIETRRTIRCRLGEPRIWIEDEVTNRGNEPTPHHWLYHVNLGYPLLQPGARFVYHGEVCGVWGTAEGAEPDTWKRPEPPRADHAGSGEGGLVIHPEADSAGRARVGLVDAHQHRALCLTFDREQLPNFAHWMHYGPRGSYVSGLEPFFGQLLNNQGTTDDTDTVHRLGPGETRKYAMEIAVLTELTAIRQLIDEDATVTSR